MSAMERLLDFAERTRLIEAEDRAYARNRLLEAMRLDAPGESANAEAPLGDTMTEALNALCDDAVRRGVINDTGESRDLFSAKLAGCVTPSPYEVRARFFEKYRRSPEEATKWFYQMCRDADYIKVDRIRKNARFFAEGLEITINLSKPEKDPRDIANALKSKAAGYPKCMLCVENPGYAGRPGFPARQNHRMIPLNLNGESWHMQYSPYLYYNEHCIVLSDIHRPMAISEAGFRRLFAFVEQVPHYFLGSNADLPIVGGSILTHDHFQGGNYEFPMDRAGDEIALTADDPAIRASIVDWPMSCLRLKSTDAETLVRKAVQVLNAWRGYSDEALGVYAETDQKHNTITPILRRAGGEWKLDLVLRNNRTSAENPLGIFHPHADLHHIKKENIGLIEVMGLMILPGRLLTELKDVEAYLTGERALTDAPAADAPLARHWDWTRELVSRFGSANTPERATEIIHKGLGEKCRRVLADAGVYKQTPEGREGFVRFLNTCGFDRA
ncbi:MAG: UDP-glucose--hexose-1-phosphate uridylyltransferase [Clostridiales bacterium]|nr:UDP-glucose--hexose-1-phosphate uridylyltransferase [Clostridiales bacterium]